MCPAGQAVNLYQDYQLCHPEIKGRSIQTLSATALSLPRYGRGGLVLCGDKEPNLAQRSCEQLKKQTTANKRLSAGKASFVAQVASFLTMTRGEWVNALHFVQRHRIRFCPLPCLLE